MKKLAKKHFLGARIFAIGILQECIFRHFLVGFFFGLHVDCLHSCTFDVSFFCPPASCWVAAAAPARVRWYATPCAPAVAASSMCVFQGFEMNHFTTSKVCAKLYDHCNHQQCSVNNLLPQFGEKPCMTCPQFRSCAVACILMIGVESKSASQL